ncbi:MAG: hypothetical protein LAT55_10315 [Opitutales bacterium]|nr:hypothetical protein [Opitutales bacterium]
MWKNVADGDYLPAKFPRTKGTTRSLWVSVHFSEQAAQCGYVGSVKGIFPVTPETPIPLSEYKEPYLWINGYDDEPRAVDWEKPFPPPPFAGNDSMVPLCSAEEVQAEIIANQSPFNRNEDLARELERIHQGTSYLYAIYHPLRCTLYIEREPDGKWHATGALQSYDQILPGGLKRALFRTLTGKRRNPIPDNLIPS